MEKSLAFAKLFFAANALGGLKRSPRRAKARKRRQDAAVRGRRRPEVSKQEVCERKASPVTPVNGKSLAFAKLFFAANALGG